MADNHSEQLDKPQLQQLYQYAMVLTQQHDSAQDLLQTAVEHYLLEIKRGKYIQQKMAYLRTTIRNRFIDHYRSQQRWQDEPFQEETPHDISPLDLEQLHIQQQTLERVWQTLSPEDREILYHWAVLGYSTDEACDLLAMPRGTFLSRIHRLRKRCETQQDELFQYQGGNTE